MRLKRIFILYKAVGEFKAPNDQCVHKARHFHRNHPSAVTGERPHQATKTSQVEEEILH